MLIITAEEALLMAEITAVQFTTTIKLPATTEAVLQAEIALITETAAVVL